MKKIYLGMLLSLILALMAGMVQGACTCDVDQTQTTLGDSATHIRNTSVNISTTISCSGIGTIAENATGGVLTGSPGTITGTLTYNFSVSATNITYMNFTVNTRALPDDTQQTFTITIKNDTTEETLATCTETFYSDNSVPVSTLSTPTDKSKDVDGLVLFTYTATNSSSCDLYLEDAGKYTKYAMTESSDSCTYTATIVTNGFHSHYAITSDGLNLTTSAVSTVEVRKPGSSLIDTQVTGITSAKGVGIVTGFFDFIIRIFHVITFGIFT